MPCMSHRACGSAPHDLRCERNLVWGVLCQVFNLKFEDLIVEFVELVPSSNPPSRVFSGEMPLPK